jgi:hypothetical protein
MYVAVNTVEAVTHGAADVTLADTAADMIPTVARAIVTSALAAQVEEAAVVEAEEAALHGAVGAAAVPSAAHAFVVMDVVSKGLT